jgi:hypothetical protein
MADFEAGIACQAVTSGSQKILPVDMLPPHV